MIEIKTESIETLETMKELEIVANKSSFDFVGKNGKLTATRNLGKHIKLEKTNGLLNLGIKSMF